MLRVLAIDDEPLALRQLVSYIQKVPYLELVKACRSAAEAQEALATSPVDAMFCDINMPDLNGLDFVRQLQSPPLVVFTTAYSGYALEGFRVDAVDYLLKPFTLSEFQASAERLLHRHELQQMAASAAPGQPAASGQQAAPGQPTAPTLYIRADHRTVALSITDILRVQAMGEYLRIYLFSQPRPLMTLMSMKRMEETLPQELFLRIHRSHIINLSQVTEVKRGHVRLTDGTELPIGDNYRHPFERWLASHIIRKA